MFLLYYTGSGDYFADAIRLNIVRLIFALIQLAVMGFITRKINRSKGYDGGFAWGFFLGWIGIIVVATRKSIKTEKPEYSHVEIEQAVEVRVQQELERLKEEEEKARQRDETTEAEKTSEAMEQFLLLAQDCETDQQLLELWERLQPAEDTQITEFLKKQVKAARIYGGNNCQNSVRRIQEFCNPKSNAVAFSKSRQTETPVYVNTQMREEIETRVQQRLAQMKEEEEKARLREEKIKPTEAMEAMDQFLLLAQNCKTDQEMLELWERLHPVEDPEIGQILKNSVITAKMYGTNGCQKSIKKIQAMYKPESVEE